MAESQVPYPYAAGTLGSIIECLSDPRFFPYRHVAAFRDRDAIEHYLYNARLAKSLLFPLHVCEVVVRNAANDVLKADFQGAWYRNPDFLSKVSTKTQNAVTEAAAKLRTSNVDDLVASVSLDFWSHLFRAGNKSLWWGRFPRVVRASPQTTYVEFGTRLRNITGLRNRIAHHESLLTLNLSYQHAEILELVGCISSEAREWLAAHSTYVRVARSAPKGSAQPAPTVGERCDANIQMAQWDTPLHCLRERPMGPWVIYAGAEMAGVITGRELSQYLLIEADCDGLLAVNEHTAGDVLTKIPVCRLFKVLDEHEPIAALPDHLTTKVRNVLVVGPHGGLKGVIMLAHRRY
jgi:hypothetical protein